MMVKEKDFNTPVNGSKAGESLEPSKFRVALLAIILILIAIRFVDIFVYPKTTILPTDFFFALAIVQLFFLWFDYARENHYIRWVKRKREILNEMKAKFSMITSHELRTPVALIGGRIELLKDKMYGEMTQKQEQVLDKVGEYIERLEKILDSLTKLHLGTFKTLEEELNSFSIEDVIKSTMEDVMPFIKKRQQKLFMEIEEGIPAIKMEENGIRRSLVNLLLNSIRFTPDNGQIVVRAKNEKNNIRVEVEDNGIGIPESELNNVFESFYEVRDTKEHSSGTIEFRSGGMGLGLTIAKNIIDLHDGKIWAESEKGKGAKVVFTLPKNR